VLGRNFESSAGKLIAAISLQGGVASCSGTLSQRRFADVSSKEAIKMRKDRESMKSAAGHQGLSWDATMEKNYVKLCLERLLMDFGLGTRGLKEL
jgi:hypothetical protein